MSATNHTTNYELPIFVGTDKPAWLVDWNSAMTAIDTAIHTAEGKADQAGTDIGGIVSSISTINSTLTSINTAVSQLRIDTNANTGSINTITSLIGNGEPTTTDKTIIGAINEINAEVYDFDLSSATVGNITSPVSGVTVDGASTDISALLNASCSVGKVYGILSFTLSNASFSAGTLFASIPITGLTVETPFRVSGYAMYVVVSGDVVMVTIELGFRNGGVDIYWTGGAVGATVTKAYTNLPPCLLFLKDLGD